MGLGRNAVIILRISATCLLLAVFLFAPLRTAHASVFSSILDFFGVGKSLSIENMPNSQNMALLQAALSPSTASAASSTDVRIVEGTALLSDAESPIAGDSDRVGSDQISLYVVHNGDTLPAVAKMFGVTTNTIVWANDLKGNKLTPGQTLVILPISGVEHVVKPGDTIQSIAKLHKGDGDEIMQYNNLTKNSKLAAGDIIIVPDGEVTTSSPTPTSRTGSSSKTSRTSSVAPSDSSDDEPVYSSSGAMPLNAQCSNYPSHVGYFMRPVASCIKTQGLHGHNGIDLAASEGTNIMAAAEGTVIVARSSGWNGGYGNYVVISHPNGTQTLYGHLHDVVVSTGDHVDQGQVIAHMGHTGEVFGNPGTHLHFEVRGGKNPF